MSSKDILDQIRDLQSLIDDFTFEEKTEILENEPTEVLQKPNEIDTIHKEDKTLVEANLTVEPLSILSYDLNLSDDFSSLVNHFNALEVPSTNVATPLVEKIKISPIIVSASDSPAPEEPYLREKLQPTRQPSSASSNKSGKSTRSQKSHKSARRLQNEKRAGHQSSKDQKKKQTNAQKYVERSYDEMMRIPDIYERVSFYEKTLDLCLREESPFKSWMESMQKKGKPEPLLGGYMPPARTPEITRSNNSSSYLDQSPSNGSSSGLSGSISMFLKKAMSGSGNLQQQNPVKGKTLPTSNVFAKTQHYVSTPRISTGGSGVFGRSISRLNMNPTRSAQLPRYAQPLKPYNRLAPILNNRVGTAQTKKQQHKPSVTLTPIITSRSNKSAPMPSLTPRSSASSPHPFFSTEYNRFSSFSNDRHSMRQNYAEGIDYLTNVLPQIDIRILQKALEEANGDSMLAISIAVSLSKQLNEPMISNRSTKFKI